MGIVKLILKCICVWNDFVRLFCALPFVLRDFLLGIKTLTHILARKSSKINAISDKDATFIVSLTSYPARYKTLHITLYSLLRQSHPADRIILWLSEQEQPDGRKLPFLIDKLSRRGISVQWVEDVLPTNYKVYNKLLPSLVHCPDATVVVCDDDAIYPKHWLRDLYRGHKESPQCIVGHKGFILTLDSETTLNSYSTLAAQVNEDIKNNHLEKYRVPNIAIFLEGVGGVLFPSHCMPKEIFNAEQFQRLSPHADDIWFNAMAMLNGCPKRVINPNPKFLPSLIARTQQVGLSRINLGQNQNDIQFKQVFDAYNLYQKIR